MQPLVSIITPCYNGGHCVHRLFDSVLAQTYSPIEFILIDDGSIDNTLEVVEEYRPKFEDAGISFICFHQENQGLGGAINAGLKLMTGDYFCWPDADDFLEPESIQKRVTALEVHSECAVVTSEAYRRKSDDLSRISGRIEQKEPFRDQGSQFLALMYGNGIFCSGCHMVRVKCLRDVNPEMQIYPARRGQNWQLLLPLYYKYPRYYMAEPLYSYIDYANSMSKNERTFESELFRFEEHEEILHRSLLQIEKVQKRNLHDYHMFVEDKLNKHKLCSAIAYKRLSAFKELFAYKQKSVGLDCVDDALLKYGGSKTGCKVAAIGKRFIPAMRSAADPRYIVSKIHAKEDLENEFPLVTVFTSIFNGEEFIEDYVKCIMLQSYKNVQLIIMNDGSTDKTDELVRARIPEIEEKGYQVIYCQSENVGISEEVRRAVKMATGKYYMTFDVDDILYRDCIYEKVMYLESHPNADLVMHNGYYVSKAWELGITPFFYKAPYENGTECYEGLLDGSVVNWPGSWMVRSQALLSIVDVDEDWYVSPWGTQLQFMLPVTLNGEAGYIDKPLMDYYVRPNSDSHQGGIQRAVTRGREYGKIREKVTEYSAQTKEIRDKYLEMNKAHTARNLMRSAVVSADEDLFKEASIHYSGSVGYMKFKFYISKLGILPAYEFPARCFDAVRRRLLTWNYNRKLRKSNSAGY